MQPEVVSMDIALLLLVIIGVVLAGIFIWLMVSQRARPLVFGLLVLGLLVGGFVVAGFFGVYELKVAEQERRTETVRRLHDMGEQLRTRLPSHRPPFDTHTSESHSGNFDVRIDSGSPKAYLVWAIVAVPALFLLVSLVLALLI